MKRRNSRIWRWMLLMGASGTLFQAGGGIGFTRSGWGGSCQGRDFYQNGALTSIDFCYLLDCQNGFLGGAIQPCGNPNTTADDLFVDCTTQITTTTDTTTTTGN